MDWIKRHVRLLGGIVGVVSGVVGLVAVFVPNLSSFLAHHWRLGWAAAVVLLVLTCWTFGYLSDQLLLARAERDRAAAQVAASHTYPTTRDLQLFDAVLTLLPWTSVIGKTGVLDDRLIPWMDGFTAKTWNADDFDRVWSFVSRTNEKYFDDPVVNEGFQRLRDLIAELGRWMSVHGGPVNHSSDRYALLSEDRFPGGPDAYYATRREAAATMDGIFEARREFERTGRSRGL